MMLAGLARRLVLITCAAALAVAPAAFSDDISGVWKHVDEPGWIEINLEQGEGRVVRNDKFPDRVGRQILKGLAAVVSSQGTWTGQIYAEKLGEYKAATIELPEPDLMTITVKVGFMRRTVGWQRAEPVSSTLPIE